MSACVWATFTGRAVFVASWMAAPMYMWDRLYLGGGNSKRITASNLRLMGDDVIVVPNDAGIIGGVRAWEL